MVRPRSRQGFTLVEMMLVVAMIGILSALMLPGLGEMLADNRQASAAEGLVRLHRTVVSRVNETGLAHLMMFSKMASSGHGDITVFEGMNNHCQSTPWANVLAGNAQTRGHFPVATLGMLDLNTFGDRGRAPDASDTYRQVITLRAASLDAGVETGLDTVNLCVQPNGMTYLVTMAGAWTFQLQQQALLFTIHRFVGSESDTHGVDRKVLFPVGGMARFRI